MSHKKDAQYYARLCKKALQRAMNTPKDNREAFLVQKKKAEKYLKRAKELESRSESQLENQDQ